MKTISVRELQRGIRKTVTMSQDDQVVVTRNGKPAAVMVGVEGQDWETVVLETSKPFWDMIRKRRGQPTITMKEMRRRLAARQKG
jgi:prevent-host-death family protein